MTFPSVLLVRYVLLAVRALTKQRLDLALENVALRHQLEVLTRSRKQAPLRPADRLLWSWLSRVWPRWRHRLVIVQPATVIRWHHTAWRRYWTWKSGEDGAVVRWRWSEALAAAFSDRFQPPDRRSSLPDRQPLAQRRDSSAAPRRPSR